MNTELNSAFWFLVAVIAVAVFFKIFDTSKYDN